MPRPVAIPRPQSVCQICDSIITRRFYSTKPALSSHNTTRHRPQIVQHALRANAAQKALLASTVLPTRKKILETGNTRHTLGEHDSKIRATPKTAASEELSSVTNMMTYLERSKSKVLSNKRIPPEADVSAALLACRVVADYIMDDAVQPQIAHMINEFDSAASELLSLDSTSNPNFPKSINTATATIMDQVKQIIDRISDTAYAVLAHPPVFITPELLEKYVDVQARLGKPETLPQVFQLYASKPMPREGAGSISYAKQNPNKVANAIEPNVIEKALDTAIEARNLDAAVGIIENTYATKAFIRNKLLRKALLPVGTFAATPLAAYVLATNFSDLQNSMDSATATNVAFAGILAYVGCTTSIGLVALTTANDQMKRVTWAPGVPLRLRWIREEERAALDKIACAWGFQEKWRQGEEEGADWDALREYIGQKGMVLDRTELMEGMDF
ncbi:hypothetical protein F4815DRAFT_347705 [Daldinia loculata]|uniref:uncharacterized protein n=1 Tax=Daldinia loculata TaxID=103429 RepID=UPI0020C2E5A6|nr:uncharacterized protein F4817DRAFT_261809 [Daldinia loculata]KAI1650464.1 hypothetical protein F4817DRAFT_261809 [Daldinia loculata]KAI2783323.1 hypothetical protein F4815DRAFT_347705 [Daldinia loculata]